MNQMKERINVNRTLVFVKAPVPGQVKTRLCPPLSADQATTLYRAFVRDTLRTVRKVAVTQARILYRPAKGFPDLTWLGSGYSNRLCVQRGSDLGMRLRRAFHEAFRAGARKVLAIGSDTPHLD